MSEQLQILLKQLRSDLLELYGTRLDRLILFGSQARGTATENSDIDVLIILKGQVNPGEEIKRTGHLISDLSLQYDLTISRLFMDSEKFSTANTPLLLNIRKEGITF
ncbi:MULTISPECIES: nucleotidyltransferase domain-containing protein [Planktothricoides]|uniref:Nucleotidyltransferase domain-containing protein n=2 Tax=Planktothricoides raciborskii TaxID=132608 RepID=A0AAU8JND5_9CYAN|nr:MULTISPECIES: nucleotidyltransferase domain-containing protein [Planktothricoides]KOR38266.1 nucleotidyltransferase [Planktothricoides sp. SR001]MBD2543314.1 nucleotidyltransferase domain-containing protein [Planktothricoides raciborskii FACHB-1370]MBD2581614.1 nucleotidyltransferase domain-containing protein [Planktothricoides raciborskii FACHB-1261]